MPIAFDKRVRVSPDVLISDVGGESVLLNLKTESYFGLDVVGARMWAAVTDAESIEAAYAALQTQYDVAPERLRSDLDELLGKLVEHGLVELK